LQQLLGLRHALRAENFAYAQIDLQELVNRDQRRCRRGRSFGSGLWRGARPRDLITHGLLLPRPQRAFLKNLSRTGVAPMSVLLQAACAVRRADATQDLEARVRHEWRKQDRREPNRLRSIEKHLAEPIGQPWILAQCPRSRLRDEFVAGVDKAKCFRS